MLEHIETIVDEVRSADGGAVISLFRSLEAEPNAVLSHAGALVERLALQPTPSQLLNARATLGDEPHSARESAGECSDGVERSLAGRRGEGRLVASAEKRGVGPPRKVGSANDDSPNVDAENRL